MRDEPKFQTMTEEIEADVTAQLARERKMQSDGELPPTPERAAE